MPIVDLTKLPDYKPDTSSFKISDLSGEPKGNVVRPGKTSLWGRYWNNLKENASENFEQFSESASKATDSNLSFGRRFLESGKQILPGLATLASPFTAAVETAVEVPTEAAIKAGSAILPESIKSPLRNALGKAVSIAGATYEALPDWGKTIVDQGGDLLDIIAAASAIKPIKGVASELSAVSKELNIPNPLKPVGKIGSDITRFGVSLATGLAPDTITTIKNAPEAFKIAQSGGITRESIGNKTLDAINKRLDDISETGKKYDSIKSATEIVKLPKNQIDDVLKSRGVTIKNGELDFSGTNIGDAADMASVQKAYNFLVGKKELSGADIINLRGKLDDTINWNSQATSKGQSMVKKMRKIVDDAAKGKIKGLSELDAKYASETSLLRQIKKDFLNPDGSLKDNALSKLANLTGKGKEQTLQRLERISPEIGKEIKVLRALEDVEIASGIKIGNYSSVLRGGGTAIGIGTGNIPLFVASILATPTIAVPVIREYGRLMKISKKVLAQIFSKLEKGRMLTATEKKIVGAAIAAQIKKDQQ